MDVDEIIMSNLLRFFFQPENCAFVQISFFKPKEKQI